MIHFFVNVITTILNYFKHYVKELIYQDMNTFLSI
jgi:hypothetical protein